MNFNLIKKLVAFAFTFLFLLITVPINNPAAIHSPWIANKNEQILRGIYLGVKQKLIQIQLKDKIVAYPYSSQAIFALMGQHSGMLVSLSQFPHNLPVEVFIDQNGKIRAMRNELEHCPETPGKKLDHWGHLATLSPNQQYYTLYHYLNGLTLFNFAEKQTPVYLSDKPLCDWHIEGTKLAYTGDDYIAIYDIQQKIKKLYPLPQNNLETVRVVTSIHWSPHGDKLLYSFLEDYPQQGSDIFQLSILDNTGREINTKIIDNLGPVCWLTQDTIALVINPTEEDLGGIWLWNYLTDKTTLLQEIDGFCNNLTLNGDANILAYTIAEYGSWQERLYLYNLTTKTTTKFKSSIFPIHNLQWISQNNLIYWDEINNTINIINEHGNTLKKSKGYLPEKSIAGNMFLFFPEKPVSEALPLFFSQY